MLGENCILYSEYINTTPVIDCHLLHIHRSNVFQIFKPPSCSTRGMLNGQHCFQWNFLSMFHSMRKKRISSINAIVDATMRVCFVTLRGTRRSYKHWIKTIIVLWIVLLIYICVSIIPSEESTGKITSSSLMTKSPRSTIIRSIILV